MKMLRIKALAPEDGWALVRSGSDVLMLRPPYKEANSSVVAEGAIEKAIQSYGFKPADLEFPSWGDLVSYLQRKLLDARADAVRTLPDFGGVASDIFSAAPPEVIGNLMNRIRNEFIASGEWRAAFRLLEWLYRSDAAKRDARNYSEITELLNQCALRVVEDATRRFELAEEDVSRNFPNAAAAYGKEGLQKLAREVCERGQVFAVGAR